MYARVPQAMAQFVLKIELLSHIMGTTLILEMARAYGLRPRLWLLLVLNLCGPLGVKREKRMTQHSLFVKTYAKRLLLAVSK